MCVCVCVHFSIFYVAFVGELVVRLSVHCAPSLPSTDTLHRPEQAIAVLCRRLNLSRPQTSWRVCWAGGHGRVVVVLSDV